MNPDLSAPQQPPNKTQDEKNRPDNRRSPRFYYPQKATNRQGLLRGLSEDMHILRQSPI
jgi:hypothetical protein